MNPFELARAIKDFPGDVRMVLLPWVREDTLAVRRNLIGDKVASFSTEVLPSHTRQTFASFWLHLWARRQSITKQFDADDLANANGLVKFGIMAWADLTLGGLGYALLVSDSE